MIGCLGAVSCKKNSAKEKLNIHSEFTELLGKNTPHWKYINKEKDLSFIDSLKSLYDQNKHAQFATPRENKIPKVVHCIWLGPRPFPQASVENMRTWVAHHPDWKFKFWTDRKRLAPCQRFEVELIKDSHFSRLKQYYDQATNWGEKADYLRYEILYREGGVYIDHDANALQSFDCLNSAYDFYGCTEAPHPLVDDRAVTVGNGLIGVKPHHPILLGCLDQVEEIWKTLDETGKSKLLVNEEKKSMLRSYIALTHSIMKNSHLSGNCDIVFPASYFFASSYLPSFYSHHFYATAWINHDINVQRRKILDRIKLQKRKYIKTKHTLKLTTSMQLILMLVLSFMVFKRIKNDAKN